MNSAPAAPQTLLFSTDWGATTELSFVTRSVAGIASRFGAVEVVVPLPSGSSQPDGAFDLRGLGVDASGGWPNVSEVQWSPLPTGDGVLLVDQLDQRLSDLLDAFRPRQPILAIAEPLARPPRRRLTQLRFVPDDGATDTVHLGLSVAVNPLAAGHRHNGFGFTGYILVLSNRIHGGSPSPPTDAVAWITSAFPSENVVVVEDATAAVWRGRALRGVVNVDTRTDLWRLIAHARVMVDVSPGPLLARECVESLLYGTPIIVPQDSVAAHHVRTGGGFSFADTAGLLDCLEALRDDGVRSAMAADGRTYAQANYGGATQFNAALSHLFGPTTP